jgi:metal-sulfur cluster biosynthetic enzyme
MITEEHVTTLLKTVLDPELHINVVDLGLIYKVTVTYVEQLPHIHVLMTLTTPGCPLGGTIMQMVKDALFPLREEGLDVDRAVDVEITFDPPWSIEAMSEEARAELGFET